MRFNAPFTWSFKTDATTAFLQEKEDAGFLRRRHQRKGAMRASPASYASCIKTETAITWAVGLPFPQRAPCKTAQTQSCVQVRLVSVSQYLHLGLYDGLRSPPSNSLGFVGVFPTPGQK